ncbi:MAG: UPF0158 family protein [Nanoarchaeota archaeon]
MPIKMKLKILFDDLKDAFEQSSVEHHYFIDKKDHQIIFISEYEDNPEAKLEELDNDNFIPIPKRMPCDDFDMMQSFVYSIGDVDIAQKFEAVLNTKKPFRHFKELLNFHPEIKEKWFTFKDKELRNETMNWLCINNIESEDKNFMPKVEIKELSKDEVKLPEEWETFRPVACMNCHNAEGLAIRYFELNVPAENMLIEKEIERVMKEKFEVENYGTIGGGDKVILTASECPKCKSNEIFEDF